MSTTLKAARPARALTFPMPTLMHCVLRAMYEAADHTATPEWGVHAACDVCRSPVQAAMSFIFGGHGQVRHHRLSVESSCRCGSYLDERTIRITALVPSDHVPAPNAE